MNHKQNFIESLSTENGEWVLHFRAEKVSQPWSVLETFDNKLSAIIKAHQVSAEYFMVKVTDPEGSVTWST